MKVLSIDSSSKVATAAILEDNILLGEYVLNNKKEHSVILLPMIENLLKDCNLSIDDIDGYVVSKGPGSFTGLRIGMATIKGMSFGSNKPYISLSSLEGLAYNLINFDGIICSVMDALRENVYTAVYKSKNTVLEPLLNPTSMELSDLLDYLKKYDDKVIFVGDGVIKHKEYILNNFDNPIFPPDSFNIIKASTIAEIGINKLKQGLSDNPNSGPVYLKKPQAERERERRLKLDGTNA